MGSMDDTSLLFGDCSVMEAENCRGLEMEKYSKRKEHPLRLRCRWYSVN